MFIHVFSRRFEQRKYCVRSQSLFSKIIKNTKCRGVESLNPFTARANVGSSDFWVCGQNPMMRPFKWNLSVCTFKWCYLFLKFYKMKFGNFCWILPLATLKVACEQQTHFRSSLLSLWKIASANPSGKTISVTLNLFSQSRFSS